jgi:hypothetical protein
VANIEFGARLDALAPTVGAQAERLRLLAAELAAKGNTDATERTWLAGCDLVQHLTDAVARLVEDGDEPKALAAIGEALRVAADVERRAIEDLGS